MCGILGIYDFSGGLVDRDVVRRMSDALEHRGPDDQGAFFGPSVALGSRRLSIVDVAAGAQPMCTAGNEVVIVFNGEIYNHLELREELRGGGHGFRTSSDTETILQLYLSKGVACLPRLNGMFAFAIWDQRSHTLLIARDSVGIKPLFLQRTSRQLRFASEIKGLLADSAVPRQMNGNGLGSFFRYGSIGDNGTAFEGIEQLAPGHYMLVSEGGTTLHEYQKPPGDVLPFQDENEAALALQTAVSNAVRRQGKSEVPLGVFLSGGVDSSSIVHFMASSSSSPLRTYAVGYEGTDAFYDEREHAAFVSKHYGTRHQEIVVGAQDALAIPQIVEQLDEPSCDSAFLTTSLVARLAARDVKVVLSGVGGDELFGGYWRYLGPSLTGPFNRLPRGFRRIVGAALQHFPSGRGSPILNYARLCQGFVLAHELPEFERYDQRLRILPDGILSRLAPGFASYASNASRTRQTIFEACPAVSGLDKIIALDIKTTLVDQLLMITDRTTMAAGLEARIPFLDQEVLELARRIPSTMKVNGLKLRHIQKLSMRGQVPARVLSRRKRGFGCPIGRWFRDELREMLCDVLSFASLERTQLLKASVVQELVQQHLKQEQDHSEALLALLTFELWRRRWFA